MADAEELIDGPSPFSPLAATVLSSPDGGTRTTDLNQRGGVPGDDPLLPDGLDSHRYRCAGNGVVAPVAEWIGERLREVMVRLLAEAAA